MMLTYRYRILPTKRQHRALERILESQRQLYNAALEERIDAYRKRGISRTFIDQCYGLTEWRQCDPEARSVPANLQRWTLKQVHAAYQGFFHRVKKGIQAGFPRFRGKGRFDTFGFDEFQGMIFRARRIRFKGLEGGLRVHMHRPIPDGFPIKCCVFHRGVGGWSVGFVVKVAEAPPRPPARAVGVDLGISTFAALSDGGFIPSLRAARRAERRLRVAQRALARKKKGSRGRFKSRVTLGRCYAVLARVRWNHLHQSSARLIRDYDAIAVEKLNVKALARSVLAKDVCDASWGRFISMLRYKAACAGTQLMEVDPCGTSQECSCCGTRVPKELANRVHACGYCGLAMDRDLNAARNILHRAGLGPGLPNVADCGMRADGNLDESAGFCK